MKLLPGLLLFCAATALASSAADAPPACRLTVELKDGSRVVGESAGKYFRFHSALLGEIKLAPKDLRAVECLTTNSAKLTTASGDTLTVSFADSALGVKTSFGRVELALDTVRKLTVSTASAGSHHQGLVSLWSGEGAAEDSVGGNNGLVPAGTTYVPAKVGQGFNFTGIDNITVPNHPSLNPTEQLTIEGWFYPRSRPYARWTQLLLGKNNGREGMRQYNLIVGDSPTHPGMGNFRGDIGLPAGFLALDGETVLQPNTWYHVAVTYDGSMFILYVNGHVDAQMAASGSIVTSAEPLRIGGVAASGYPAYNFSGIIDEAAIYNRALSQAEIREDYEAGNRN